MTTVQQPAIYNISCITTVSNRTLCIRTQKSYLRHGAEMSRSGQAVKYRSFHVSWPDAHTETFTHTHTHTHTQCATLTPVPSCFPLNLICLNEFTTTVNALLRTYNLLAVRLSACNNEGFQSNFEQ
jgi:hypothetical protein